MLEAVRRQLSVLTDLLDRQIDASDSSKATETLRDILDSQKRHLQAIIDVIDAQQREEQDKFERLVTQSQENAKKYKAQADRIRVSVSRLSQPPPSASPQPPAPPSAMLRESITDQRRSLSPAVASRRSVSPLPPPKPRLSQKQSSSRSPKRRATAPAADFDPQLSALEGLQRKLARQVNELQGLALDDPVARAVSQSLTVDRDDNGSRVRFF